MYCKLIYVYLFIRKMLFIKFVRDLMLFFLSDNIFKFFEIIDLYFLFKKRIVYRVKDNRVRRVSFKSIYNNLWL